MSRYRRWRSRYGLGGASIRLKHRSHNEITAHRDRAGRPGPKFQVPRRPMGKSIAFARFRLKLDQGALGVFVVRSGGGINGDRATLARYAAGRQLIPGYSPAAKGDEKDEEQG